MEFVEVVVVFVVLGALLVSSVVVHALAMRADRLHALDRESQSNSIESSSIAISECLDIKSVDGSRVSVDSPPTSLAPSELVKSYSTER